MDDHFKLALLLLFHGMFPVQGYIFRVISEASEKGVCLTDKQSSAIAPIQPLNGALKTSSENGWLASLNENIDEFECIPNAECKNWNLTNAEVVSFDSSFGMRFSLMDQTRFWDYFQEFKTGGNEEFISPAIPFPYFNFWSSSLAFSILAEDEAQILFTSDKQWQGKPGILLSLEATGEVCISVCSVVYAKDSICRKLPRSSTVDNRRKWAYIQLTVRTNFFWDYWYWIKLNDDSPIPLDNKEIRKLRYITFRSKSMPGVFKLIKYYAVKVQNGSLTFKSPSIDLLKPRIISLTFAEKTQIDYSVVVDGYAQNATTTSVEENELFIDYLQIENTSSAMSTVTISLTFDDYVNLLSVSTVSEGHRAIYIDGDLSACQILSTGEVTSSIQNDTVAESFPGDRLLEDICNKLNAPNCRGVEACSPEGCFCFSGHTRSSRDGKCTQGCDGNQFGPNCVYKANGTFKAQSFDVHTGFPNCEKTLEAPGYVSYLIVLLLSTTVLCLLQSLVIVYILLV